MPSTRPTPTKPTRGSSRCSRLSHAEPDLTDRAHASRPTTRHPCSTPLFQANKARDVLVAARRASSARYALRNTLVTVALSAMMLLLCFYVLHTMTFADPWFVLTYRRHARVPGRLFHQLPDVHAMAWAFGIVGGYYFITLTVRQHASECGRLMAVLVAPRLAPTGSSERVRRPGAVQLTGLAAASVHDPHRSTRRSSTRSRHRTGASRSCTTPSRSGASFWRPSRRG